MNLHLFRCEQRVRMRYIPGCHFSGNTMTLEEHKKDRAEQHVGLLTDHAKKLAGAIVRQVKKFYAKKPAKNYF